MEVKVDVTMTTKDMFNFFMYHTYSKPSGILSIVFGLGMFGLFAYYYGEVPSGQSIMYLLFGLFFIIYNPVSFYGRAKTQVKTAPIFKAPISYTFNKEGIRTEQNDEKAQVKWSDVYKIASTGKSVVIYMDKSRASIIPLKQLGSKYMELAELAKANMEPKKVKLR